MISPFQAIMTAVGGTVGFGNIAGVATAVAAGGPGAVFWMWMTAALGMILKQVEVTLGLYYRRRKDNGDTYGGPTYYMDRHLLHLLCHFFNADRFSGCFRCAEPRRPASRRPDH